MVSRILEISSLSGDDYINLVGQYNSVVRDNGKSEVDPRLLKRGYTPEQIEATRRTAKSKFNPVTSLNLRFKTHFSKFEYEYFDYVLHLFDQYKKGNLPFPGCLSEQPAQIIETFQVLTALENENELRLRRQVNKENGRSKRKN